MRHFIAAIVVSVLLGTLFGLGATFGVWQVVQNCESFSKFQYDELEYLCRRVR